MSDRLPQPWTLKNASGMTVRILDYGARIASLRLPLPEAPREICLGYEQDEDWLTDPFFMGAICGRFANRIANGRFSLGGENYQLDQNDGDHHLHGGSDGFHSRFWQVGKVSSNQITLSLHSADSDMGYPGNLMVRVTYLLGDDNSLSIGFEAHADQDTVVNLTSHPYFNLAGTGDLSGHLIETGARQFTALDSCGIPTGIVSGIHRLPGIADLDHNLVLDQTTEDDPAASLISPDRHVRMDVFTDYPGMQIYGGKHLGTPFAPNEGACLEPQYYPDSPNKPGFPSPFLGAGDIFRRFITYRFSWDYPE